MIDGEQCSPYYTSPAKYSGLARDPNEILHSELENFVAPDIVGEGEMVTVGFIVTDQISPGEYELLLDESGKIDLGLLFRMYLIQQKALSKAEELFPNMALWNDPGDAFRHAYWSALMTSEFGEEFAEKFATAHETEYNYNPSKAETFMDLHNNEVGRNIAILNPNVSDEDLQQIIMSALQEGQLYVWDGSDIYFSNACPMCSVP